jgi:hypothetical protein
MHSKAGATWANANEVGVHALIMEISAKIDSGQGMATN